MTTRSPITWLAMPRRVYRRRIIGFTNYPRISRRSSRRLKRSSIRQPRRRQNRRSQDTPSGISGKPQADIAITCGGTVGTCVAERVWPSAPSALGRVYCNSAENEYARARLMRSPTGQYVAGQPWLSSSARTSRGLRAANIRRHLYNATARTPLKPRRWLCSDATPVSFRHARNDQRRQIRRSSEVPICAARPSPQRAPGSPPAAAATPSSAPARATLRL